MVNKREMMRARGMYIFLQLPSGNLNIDFNSAVACVRSAFVSNLEMMCGLTGHLQKFSQREKTKRENKSQLKFIH